MRKPLFSLIITAYNIENYIVDCIKSVKKQTYADFECIVVDDESDDGTADAIRHSIEGDERFRLMSISHGGQHRAKNAGLEMACGEYIMFPDGDDTLQPECLMDCAENVDGCDLLIFGINFIEYDNNIIKSKLPVSPGNMEFESGSELADWYIMNHKLLLYSNANKCYRKAALDAGNVKYGEDLAFGEDRKFNFDFLRTAGKIKIIPGVYYNYRRINNNSLCSVFRTHFIDDILPLHEMKMNCMLEISGKADDQEKMNFLKYDICRTIQQALEHVAEHDSVLSDSEKDEEIQYIRLRKMPEYFYSDRKNHSDDLIDYINSVVFPEYEETDMSQIDTVVALGSSKCRYRIEHAFKLFGNVRYVCCGGNICDYPDPENNPQTEAEYMKAFLQERGIGEVITENNSRNTYENIVNTVPITGSGENVAVITGEFHAKRVKQIIDELGLNWKVVGATGPNTSPDCWFRNKIGINAVIEECRKLMHVRMVTL